MAFVDFEYRQTCVQEVSSNRIGRCDTVRITRIQRCPAIYRSASSLIFVRLLLYYISQDHEVPVVDTAGFPQQPAYALLKHEVPLRISWAPKSELPHMEAIAMRRSDAEGRKVSQSPELHSFAAVGHSFHKYKSA